MNLCDGTDEEHPPRVLPEVDAIAMNVNDRELRFMILVRWELPSPVEPEEGQNLWSRCMVH